MAVYFKYKSEKDYNSIPLVGSFISVSMFKQKIFESNQYGRGKDFDVVVMNAQTSEVYVDDEMLIPKNTSVIIRRVPGLPRMPIVTDSEPKVEDRMDYTEPESTSFVSADSSVMKCPGELDWDDFGGDLYDFPEDLPVQTSHTVSDAQPTSKDDEDSKIKALIDTPALDRQDQGVDGSAPGRGFGSGMGGRMMSGRGFGRGVVLERKTPPRGYICHRCKVPGHFIQHCPTNGDPNYGIKRVRPPTGIPKSMLMANPDGSYALPSGAVAVLRPNEDAFEKAIEGLPSTHSVGDLPPELHCSLCKEVMRDAVLTSKCCFESFCDKCIRNYIMSKSMCVCGSKHTLADDLLPNKRLRDTIHRILERGGSSSVDKSGITFEAQDMESAHCPQPKIPSPVLSASKGEEKQLSLNEETPQMQETTDEVKLVLAPLQMLEKVRTTEVADVSEATHESMSVKESASQGDAPPAEEEVQQRLASGEPGKKRKRKEVRMSANDMQWKTSQYLAADNYMMPMGPAAYNPYWNGMQPGMGMEGYMAPYGGPIPYMGYGLGPMEMPFGGFGSQGYMMPMVPPQRDLADIGVPMNAGPPGMTREEFDTRKADLRRKHENERQDLSKEFSKDRESGKEANSGGDAPWMKSIKKSNARSPSPEYHRHRRERPLPERRPSRDPRDHQRPKRHRSHELLPAAKHSTETTSLPPLQKPSPTSTAAVAAERKRKASVLSRISFLEEDESSDEDRHFKRKPSRYEAAPLPPKAAKEEGARHCRGTRDHRDRKRH